VAATFETAGTCVFAERLIRKRRWGSIPLCSTIKPHGFQLLTRSRQIRAKKSFGVRLTPLKRFFVQSIRPCTDQDERSQIETKVVSGDPGELHQTSALIMRRSVARRLGAPAIVSYCWINVISSMLEHDVSCQPKLVEVKPRLFAE
jgi:hypothetical protein